MSNQENQEEAVQETPEARRARAKAMTRNKVLANGSYGFVEDNHRLLALKEDKPPTLTVDVYPLNDPKDVSTINYEFKNTLWVHLIGVEGYNPDGRDAQTDVRTLQALFPEHIDAITKESDGFYFRGEKLVGNTAFEDARTDQMLQAMDVAQDIWNEKLEIEAGQFFWAHNSVGKNNDRSFLNPTSTEPKEISVPKVHEIESEEEVVSED